tara:strand:+ start:7351 stop:7500 length:150 start_codon:yes stop_codon:yes gene_type:complete
MGMVYWQAVRRWAVCSKADAELSHLVERDINWSLCPLANGATLSLMNFG